MCIYIYVYVICTWGLTELAIGAQRTAGEGRTVLGRPNPKSEKIRDYNLKTLSLQKIRAGTCKFGQMAAFGPRGMTGLVSTVLGALGPSKS